MLTRLLKHLNNYFLADDGIHRGTFTIERGGISAPFLLSGQYFRIVGSILNDGVYKYPTTQLKAETFTGAVWALRIPQEVVEIAGQMKEWEAKNVPTAFTHESFDGYSYTRATNSKTGLAASVFDAFKAVLNPYRKLSGNLEAVQPTRGAMSGYSRPYNPDAPWRD